MRLPEAICFTRRWIPIALLASILAAALSYGVSTIALEKAYTATVTMEVGLGLGASASPVDPTYNALSAQTDAVVAQQKPIVGRAVVLANRRLGSVESQTEVDSAAASASCSATGLTALFSCSITSRSAPFAALAANQIARVFKRREASFALSRYRALVGRLGKQETVLQQDIVTVIGQINVHPASDVRTNLSARLNTDNVQYGQLVAAKMSALQAEASTTAIVRVVTPAVAPDSPSSPHPTLNAAIAFFLVFIFVLGSGFLVVRMNEAVGRDAVLMEPATAN